MKSALPWEQSRSASCTTAVFKKMVHACMQLLGMNFLQGIYVLYVSIYLRSIDTTLVLRSHGFVTRTKTNRGGEESVLRKREHDK